MRLPLPYLPLVRVLSGLVRELVRPPRPICRGFAIPANLAPTADELPHARHVFSLRFPRYSPIFFLSFFVVGLSSPIYRI